MSKKPSKKKRQTSEALASALSAFVQEEEQAKAERAAHTLDKIRPDPSHARRVPPKDLTGKPATGEIGSRDQPEKKYESRRDKMTATAQPIYKRGISQITTGVTRVYKGWREKIRARKRRKELPQRFREWAAGASLTEREQLYHGLPEAAQAFTAWLAGLSAKETKVFSQRLSSFCSGLNFELSWLADLQLDNDPELKQAVEEAVVLYCLAHWKATQVQGDLKAFATFLAWQDDPSRGKNRELSQKLFAKLVEKERISAPPPELILASEEERQAHVVQAIRQVAEEDRQAFSTILKEVSL